MCYYYDEYATMFRESTPIAKKRHRCHECRKWIQPGHIYHYAAGYFDGAFFTRKVCTRCEWLREAVAVVERSRGCAHHEAYPPFDELWSSIKDYDAPDRRAIGLAYAQLVKEHANANN